MYKRMNGRPSHSSSTSSHVSGVPHFPQKARATPGEEAGARLDPRRWLRHWIRLAGALRRRATRTSRRRGGRHRQLSTGRAGLPAPGRSVWRGHRHEPQRRHSGSGARPRVGAGQHRAVRRRSGECHHLRRVGWWHECGDSARTARRPRAVPARHPPERRGSQRREPRDREQSRSSISASWVSPRRAPKSCGNSLARSFWRHRAG